MKKSDELKLKLLTFLERKAVGEKLPSRTELVSRFSTNRVVLDSAISSLVDEGVLYSNKGSGTYLASPMTHGVESWGIIVPDIIESTFSSLIHGVESITNKTGRNLIICNSEHRLDKQLDYIKRLVDSKVSGIIIIPVQNYDVKANLRLFEKLESLDVPFVQCIRNIEGIASPCVISNDFYGGYLATRHLLNQGYSRIAYLAPFVYKGSLNRCYGYMSALQEYGKGEGALIFMEFEKCNPVSLQAWAIENGVDAFFCFSDRIAAQVNEMFPTKHYGLVGYNNSAVCNELSPRLTSIDFNGDFIGLKAAELLENKLAGKGGQPFEFHLCHPTLVIRESSQKQK